MIKNTRTLKEKWIEPTLQKSNVEPDYRPISQTLIPEEENVGNGVTGNDVTLLAKRLKFLMKL